MTLPVRMLRSSLLLCAMALGLGTMTACPPPTMCSGCSYKTTSFTVTPAQLQGGSIQSATMFTEVKHPTCPYARHGSPCIATLDMDVKCLMSGAGSYTVSTTPNGYSSTSTGSASVTLSVLVGGSTITVGPINATVGNPTSPTEPATPCGGTSDPTVVP